MPTINDVRKKISSVEFDIILYGGTAGAINKLRMQANMIGQAIMEEQNVFPKEAMELSGDTQLGPKATAAFEKYCSLS